MPVKDIQGLGHSKGLAMKRLDQLWRRLSKDKQMENLHREFMQQYLDLGHMEKVEEHFDEASANNICYYLPHHGVVQPDKTTTKLRVFNGSASTTSGLSLNDLFLKGEVKEDIFEIMTRFRKHKYAFTTDIQMMFRQILIDPAQRDLLRIMWKTGAYEKPVIYRLKTATYGTTSAPFLAIRTLKQLAMDEASRFPLASKVALQDVYMDDVGCSTLLAN
ncbi:integrase catalytic domain-containing protein [Trichonephila clavipes]|nr:integrase catalytic domain-containing protein [Trichonephila clavipes]